MPTSSATNDTASSSGPSSTPPSPVDGRPNGASIPETGWSVRHWLGADGWTEPTSSPIASRTTTLVTVTLWPTGEGRATRNQSLPPYSANSSTSDAAGDGLVLATSADDSAASGASNVQYRASGCPGNTSGDGTRYATCCTTGRDGPGKGVGASSQACQPSPPPRCAPATSACAPALVAVWAVAT